MAFQAPWEDDDPQQATAWRALGRCRGVDPAVFHPEEDDDPAEDAKAICEECPVREPCLEHAIARREKDGVWGGLTAIERRRLIRRRRRRRAIAS